MTSGKIVSRKEAKLQTRRRLLRAARQLLLKQGEQAVTASGVAKAAGLANATFYEHFRNRDDLLSTLAEELFTKLREELRGPRREALKSPTSQSKLRQQFRVPLDVIAANPELFRFSLRVRHQTTSALNEPSLRLSGSTRRDLVAELVERGYPNATPRDRRRLEMIADVHIAATEVLAQGHLAGRYPDLEEIVDLLVLVTRGTRLVREQASSADVADEEAG